MHIELDQPTEQPTEQPITARTVGRRTAVLAANAHNTQPWPFVVSGDRIKRLVGECGFAARPG